VEAAVKILSHPPHEFNHRAGVAASLSDPMSDLHLVTTFVDVVAVGNS
jgi:hypothetical protein